MNLIKLHTRHAPVYIDTVEMNRGRKILTIYTARGNRLADTAATVKAREMASFGVHVANLFASPELAEADSERIYAEMEAKHP